LWGVHSDPEENDDKARIYGYLRIIDNLELVLFYETLGYFLSFVSIFTSEIFESGRYLKLVVVDHHS
jgi:N-acyl-L-homoserine lactone synthetase